MCVCKTSLAVFYVTIIVVIQFYEASLASNNSFWGFSLWLYLEALGVMTRIFLHEGIC